MYLNLIIIYIYKISISNNTSYFFDNKYGGNNA